MWSVTYCLCKRLYGEISRSISQIFVALTICRNSQTTLASIYRQFTRHTISSNSCCASTTDLSLANYFIGHDRNFLHLLRSVTYCSGRTGRVIRFDIKDSVKTILNNVSPTQFFMYPNYAGDTRFYKIGRLGLPLNGHQAVITVNLCYGFNVNNNGLNFAGYSIQNYEMKIHLYSSTIRSIAGMLP
jgi:hypothetical protein